MIEQAIYFGLGCVVAGLMALAFTPVLWARALRLTRARLQAQIPVSMQEILADRDQLRAGFAVAARGLEQEMERVRDGKAADLAELGRRAMEIFRLTEQLTGARSALAAQDAEIRQLTRDAVEAAAGLAAAQTGLQQNHAWFEQKLEQHEALKRAKVDLEHLLDQARSTVGTLQQRISGLELTIEDGDRKRKTLLQNLDSARQQAALAAEERDLLANQLATAHSAQETLRRRLAAETALVAELTEAKRAFEAEADAAKVKLRLAGTGREGPAASRQDSRADSLRESFASAQGRAAATPPRPASTLDKPNGASPVNQPGGTAPPSDANSGEADLRATIHELGLAIAAMRPAAAAMPEAAMPAAAHRPPPARGGPPPATPVSVASE